MRDPRRWAAALLLALTLAGAVIERRSPPWLRVDPLASPFGRVVEDESAAGEGEEPAEPPPPRPVHLALATEADLVLLPGVGPVTARRILALRDSLGTIGSPEQLLAVKGIGPKRLEGLRPWLLWSDPADSSAMSRR